MPDFVPSAYISVHDEHKVYQILEVTYSFAF